VQVKKIFIIIFSAIFMMAGFAKGYGQVHEADTLRHALSDASPQKMASLYNRLAGLWLDSQPGIAINYADSALYLASAMDQDTEKAAALSIKGAACRLRGLNNAALDSWRDAMVIYRDLDDKEKLSGLLIDAGALLREERDYKNAVRYHTENLAIQISLGDSTALAGALLDIALDYDKAELFDSALLYYHEGLKIARTTGNRNIEANILNNLGNIHLSWGNYSESLEYYLNSLNISEEINDSNGLSKSFNNIGIIHFDWGEWDKSLYYYQKSYVVDSLLGNITGQAQTLNNIAIIYDEMGDDEKAEEVYRQSLDLAKIAGNFFMIAVSSSNLGEFHAENGNYDIARRYFEDAMDYYTRANSTIGIAETDILMGGLLSKTGQYTEALEYFSKGLEKVRPLNLSYAIMNALLGMEKVYVETGNMKAAYACLKEYHELNDSIFNIKISNQLALLQKGYEIQKLDQEMELQQARFLEQKSRIRRQTITLAALAGITLIIIIFSILLGWQYRLRLRAWKQLLAQHREILKNRQELILAKEKAEESDRLKTAFLMNLSHELRTPMNGIMGFTELLKKGTASQEEQQNYLELISSASKQLLSVLNDIIDMAAIETGQIRIEREVISPEALFTRLFDQFQGIKEEMGKKNIALRCSLPVNSDEHLIMADGKRLSQIIQKLLDNALTFTSEGEVEFGYTVKDMEGLRIFVRDTGIGIERRQHEVIFEKFRQVDNTTTRKHGGSGLGLAISKGLAEMMGGYITLASEIGKGSTFYIDIPYIAAE
jgi:signal transduction histidine kinase